MQALITVASPVKDVGFKGDRLVELAREEFTVKDTMTPPTGAQSSLLLIKVSAILVSVRYQMLVNGDCVVLPEQTTYPLDQIHRS